ncbi:MAG TPA: serine/threonine-protein kinase [Polyangia bacterium]
MIGATLGNYRITAKLGEGGMGAVYVAEHALIGRKAAIKVLLPEFSHNQEIVGRFFNEARSTALIKHPGLVDIFDFGYDASGSAYIVMEYLDGESLAGYLRRVGPVGTSTVCAIGRQIAAALATAHAAGIVHRDLKPDNVFLVPDPDQPAGVRVKILDFGIAKLVTDGGMTASMKTRTGAVMGTPIYMSPEQCRGAGQVDARTDIYSLGCILFEMVCGRPPFVHEGVGEIIAAQIFEQPIAPHVIEPTVVPALERVILRALAKTPDERQHTMEQLKGELDVVTSGRFETRAIPLTPTMERLVVPRRSPVVVPLVIGLLLVGGAGAVAVVKLAGGGAPSAAKPDGAVAAAVPPPAAAPASAPARAARPAKVKLSVVSQPTGAQVYREADGVLVGTAPLVYEIPPADGVAVFRLKLAGHRDGRAELRADRDGAVTVPLEAAAKPARPVKAAEPPRPAPPPPATVPAKAPEPPPPPPPTKVRKPVRDGVVDPFAQ